MIRMSLRAARVNRGLLQRESAEALGVNKRTIVSWENGETKPSTKYIEPICNLYGCTIDDIDWNRAG